MANDLRWVNRAWSRPPFKGWPEKFNAVLSELTVARGFWAVNGPCLPSDYGAFYDAAYRYASTLRGGPTKGNMMKVLRNMSYFRNPDGLRLVTVSRFPWYYLGWS